MPQGTFLLFCLPADVLAFVLACLLTCFFKSSCSDGIRSTSCCERQVPILHGWWAVVGTKLCNLMAFKGCRLATLHLLAATWWHFRTVGWQPTGRPSSKRAVAGAKLCYLMAFKGCRLATLHLLAATWWHFRTVGWQPTGRPSSCIGMKGLRLGPSCATWWHFRAAGWQPYTS